MSKTKKQAETAVEAAALQVTEARDLLGQWRDRLADARAALVRVEGESGDALLDDPEKAAAWPGKLRELRDAVTVAERALAAQNPRVAAAERAWCRAQADLLEAVELVPAREVLEKHLARTAELLALLGEHDGPYVTQLQLAQAQRSFGGLVVGDHLVPATSPKSRPLVLAVARAQVRCDVMVAMAEGTDPREVVNARPHAADLPEEDCYPEQVRGAGLVPAEAYTARIAAARALVTELEELPGLLQDEMSDLKTRAARDAAAAEYLPGALSQRRARIEEVPAELETARRELVALTGQA